MHRTRADFEDYQRRKRAVVAAGVQVAHSRLRGVVMYLDARDGWEDFDLEKAEEWARNNTSHSNPTEEN
jgi:hypothetical protein